MIKTLGFFFVLSLTLVLSTPFVIIAGFLRIVGLGRLTQGFFVAFARLWARFVVVLTGSKLLVEGLENIALKGPVCFVGNHQGDFDIVIALALIKRPFGFIAKKETLYLPFIGLWVWVLGGLFLNRNSPRRAMKTIKKGVQDISKGGAMLIFPEGTRSKGRGLLPFRPGAFKLATEARADIVPMAIQGSWRVWEEHRQIKGCKVKVSFGLPISTKDLDNGARREISDKTHAIIKEKLQQLGD